MTVLGVMDRSLYLLILFAYIYIYTYTIIASESLFSWWSFTDCIMGFITVWNTIWEKIFGTFSKHRKSKSQYVCVCFIPIYIYRWWFQIFSVFTPIWHNIFQMGWIHQLDMHIHIYIYIYVKHLLLWPKLNHRLRISWEFGSGGFHSLFNSLEISPVLLAHGWSRGFSPGWSEA